MSGEPHPKSEQLARGERRRGRIIATAKGWEKIVAAKQAPCRICRDAGSNGSVHSRIEFHHLVPRAQLGDDVADNIVPLCSLCHRAVTLRLPIPLQLLAGKLTDSEYAYIVHKLGEGASERLFGV